MSTNDQVKQEFEKHNLAVQALRNNANEVFGQQNTEALERSLNASELIANCMDGRLPVGTRNIGTGVNAILWDNLDLAADSFKKYAAQVNKPIAQFYCHESCGAEAVAQKDAAQYTEELAQKISAPYGGRVPVTVSFHFERALYLNLTPTCEPGLLDIAPGYVITPGLYPSDDLLKSEIKLATDISFGDHGYGPLFTEENPFLIVPISYESQQTEVEELIEKINSIQFDGPVEVHPAVFMPILK